MTVLLVALAALALAGLRMYGTAIRTFANTWLNPVIDPQFARTDAVKLAPGQYVAGLVLGNSNFGATATNDVQTITISGTPTGGTFRLTWSIDQQYITGSIAFDSTSAQLQTILDAIFGAGNTTVTGGPGPGSTLIITFTGKCAGQRMPLATLYSNALTGGSSPTATVAHTTTGKAAGGEWVAYSDAASEGQEVAKMLLKFPTNVNFMGVHLTGGTSQPSKAWSAPAYYRGYFRTADLTGLDAAAIADLGKIVRGSASALSNAGTILRVS